MHGTEAIRFAMDDAWPFYMYMITDLATLALTGSESSSNFGKFVRRGGERRNIKTKKKKNLVVYTSSQVSTFSQQTLSSQ